ncbi:hypothetical protein HGRIS_002232 [Hohenbuehelia grisea]|uniref:Zn(2)-C6 fungal-type domain-containing protein n=1 Tax=Hohenbuehelia grisea TaxID=104357 RepID=A0ABR3JL95_9AGAR
MADSPDEIDSAGDPLDDGQLTIKIPNPKAYMARQSAWVGRRGKPRCDHCRIHNLKCDRLLPTCNHCSWAAGRECKYTPLPTPAHRGIPRCDRCREKNYKCDRNLPVCNHCSKDEDAECNYTPKKRHKIPMDPPIVPQPSPPGGSKETLSQNSDGEGGSENKRGHTFYGQNVASSSRKHKHGHKGRDGDDSPEPDAPLALSYPQTGRFTAEPYPAAPHPPLPHIAPKPSSVVDAGTHHFVAHYQHPQLVRKTHVQHWSHPSFARLPPIILQTLSTIDSAEMPNRAAFEDALNVLQSDTIVDYKETMLLTPDLYAALTHGLAHDDLSRLSPRVRQWATLHHLRSGSKKYNLLVTPREGIYQATEDEEGQLLEVYRSVVDGDGHSVSKKEALPAFERIPVRNQIYDVLAFAHRTHGVAQTMSFEIARAGMSSINFPMIEIFTRLCPLCNLRARRHAGSVNTDV